MHTHGAFKIIRKKRRWYARRCGAFTEEGSLPRPPNSASAVVRLGGLPLFLVALCTVCFYYKMKNE